MDACIHWVIDLRGISRVELAKQNAGEIPNNYRGKDTRTGRKRGAGMIIWQHLFRNRGKKETNKGAEEIGSTKRKRKENRYPCYLEKGDEKEGWSSWRKREERKSVFVLSERRGTAHRITLIPTTDLRNYYRFSG